MVTIHISSIFTSLIIIIEIVDVNIGRHVNDVEDIVFNHYLGDSMFD